MTRMYQPLWLACLAGATVNLVLFAQDGFWFNLAITLICSVILYVRRP